MVTISPPEALGVTSVAPGVFAGGGVAWVPETKTPLIRTMSQGVESVKRNPPGRSSP